MAKRRRIATALASIGFSVIQGVAPQRSALIDALDDFTQRSAAADVSVVYSTGHGAARQATTYLIPSDYPVALGYAPEIMAAHAVSVDAIARAGASRQINLAFFAGCRSPVP